jgi:DNA polymerase elongation subunit (family B)
MRFYTNVSIVGGKIAVREYSDETGSRDYKLSASPSLYMGCDSSVADFQTLYGSSAKEVKFDSIWDAREFIKSYSNTTGADIYGQQNFVLQAINQQYTGDIKFSADKISAWSIDIETKLPVDENGRPSGFPDTETANAEITIISMQRIRDGATYTFASKEYPGPGEPDCRQYVNAGSEENLLRHFIQFWREMKVDVITGWNIDGFDIPYIVNRCNLIVGEQVTAQLSPWGQVEIKKKRLSGSFGKEELAVTIAGVSILDYLAMYKKFTFGNHESYSLGAIAEEELGMGKLDHSEHANFNDFYDNGFKKYVDYNIRDAALVKLLDDKLQLLNLIYTVAFMAKINFNDVFSPVKTWDAILHNRLLSEGKVVPLKERNPDGDKSIEGAYVKDPRVGLHDWVASLDATSLYPSIMMTMNISPDTYLGIDRSVNLEGLLRGECDFVFPNDNSCAGVTGVAFDTSRRGIIPQIVQEYMVHRKTAKGSMLKHEQEYEDAKNAKAPAARMKELEASIASLDAMQMAYKILLNSLYGAMGNSGFRFFNSNIAETITLTGQYILRSIEEKIDNKLNALFKTSDVKYLIYIDTDSVYFNLKPIVDKFLSGRTDEQIAAALAKVVMDQIQPCVNEIVSECCTRMKAYENKLFFKLEAIGDKAIWLAKKKYVIRVFSNEGVVYKKPKFKIIGLEMIKSSTPKFVRGKLGDLLPMVFDQPEHVLHEFIEDARKEFFKLPAHEIAMPRGVNELNKYRGTGHTLCAKGTPIHVRGALVYNMMIEKLNLSHKYAPIPNSAKVKYLYLREPNKARQNVISFPVDLTLPPEFGLDDSIDTYTMWEKSMIASADILVSPIGWTTEQRTVMF